MEEHIIFNQDKFANFSRIEDVFLECGLKITLKPEKEFISSSDKFVYLILSGICQQSYIAENGREVSIQFFERGHLIGENLTWFNQVNFESKFNSSQIKSLTECKMIRMTQKSFKFLMKSSHEITNYVMYQNILKQENNKLYLAMLQIHDLRQRIINLLFYMSCQLASGADYAQPVSIAVVRKEFAKLLGCSRESMGQKLLSLASDDLIQLEGKNVIIVPNKLTEHAIF